MDTLEATKRQVDKKQTRTVEERDQEIQEEEQGVLPEFNEVGAFPDRWGRCWCRRFLISFDVSDDDKKFLVEPLLEVEDGMASCVGGWSTCNFQRFS